jgi:hypothetical protein
MSIPTLQATGTNTERLATRAGETHLRLAD